MSGRSREQLEEWSSRADKASAEAAYAFARLVTHA